MVFAAANPNAFRQDACMSSLGREQLRQTFDEGAELYDRARPGYPPELFDDLVELAELPARARLLEIGCGTGQATVPLARRGYRIVCVELGAGLAAVARRKLAGFPQVEVVDGTFETWEPETGDFDAIVAATSFHWVDPAVRYERSARLLRDRGALVVFESRHLIPDDGDPFFVEVQEVYVRLTGATPSAPAPPEELADPPAEIVTQEIEASGRFGPVAVRRYRWDVVYSAEEYVNVLNTYSGHRALPPKTREALLEEIRLRIEARPSRSVRKTYSTVLQVARRL